MKFLALFVIALLALAVRDGHKSAALAAGGQNLIVYFSWSGNTRGLAQAIQKEVGGDLAEVKAVKPYPTAYNDCVNQAKAELRQNARPGITVPLADLAKYDTVYLGYPIWWGDIPMPMATLLEKFDFSGKTIAPFCTHGGGGAGQSGATIKKLAPGATVKGVFAAYGHDYAEKEIAAWLGK